MGQPFDTAAFRLTGEPFLVIPKIGIGGNLPTVSVSESGVMAYAADGGGYIHAQLAWFTLTGERVGDAGPPGRYASFSISPDGKRLTVHRAEPDDSNVWVLDLAGGAFTRLSSTRGPAPCGRLTAAKSRTSVIPPSTANRSTVRMPSRLSVDRLPGSPTGRPMGRSLVQLAAFY